ncbi:aldehyde dehydrogenase family protein, partial [Porticoccaceae bacterium]|nr:aldehyde dehydrogenase family protein [Porticoccaceae bacterium]
MSHWQNFIAGSWVDSSTSIEVENPATGEIFATVARASLADMETAVSAARNCVNSKVLSDCRPAERAELLYRIAGEIRAISSEGAELAVLENGKRLSDAEDEFAEAARY